MTLPCIIIGASHAAVQLSLNLRQQGWQHGITIISNEPYMPYQKPPLSKTYMSEQTTFEDIKLKSDSIYSNAGIEVLLNTQVTAINRSTKTLTLKNNEILKYEKLALCTGAKPNIIPLSEKPLQGVFYLRSADDAIKIRKQLSHSQKIVIIGGGFIGLELAAAFSQQGKHVTVLEAQDSILKRVVSNEVSSFISSLHKHHGVNIITQCIAKRLTGDAVVTGVECQSGDVIAADLVIIGVGVTPRTELAAAANLQVDNGILVNQYAVTSDRDIVAAGDCCSYFHTGYQRHVRVESIQNAIEQAKSAAASIMGKQIDFSRKVPRFWSDQYDIKLQICGLIDGYDNVEIVGLEAHTKLSILYYKNQQLLGAVTVNNPTLFKQAITDITNHQAEKL